MNKEYSKGFEGVSEVSDQKNQRYDYARSPRSSSSTDSQQKTLRELVGEAEKQLEDARNQHKDARDKKDGTSSAMALGEVHKFHRQLRGLYADVYSDFKDNQVKGTIKDADQLTERLNDYSKEGRRFLIDVHLKDVSSMSDRTLDGEQLEQWNALQKAFITIRGRDFNERLQQIIPLSEGEKAVIIGRYNNRYKTGIEDIDYDSQFNLKSNVRTYGKHCYETTISVEEGQESIDIYVAFKRRPQGSQGESLPGSYDEQAPYLDTKPEFHSNIIGGQISYLETDKGLKMENVSEITYHALREKETLRTMDLLSRYGIKNQFKKGETGFDETLATPIGKASATFLAEWYPHLEITEVNAVETDKGNEMIYLQYIVKNKEQVR